MAISPKEALENLSKEDKKALSKLEREIDHFLINEYGGKGITCYGVPDCSSKILHALMERYRAVGWDIKYESDQRDGDYWRFTPINNYGRKRK